MVVIKMKAKMLLEMAGNFPRKYPAVTTIATHVQEPIRDRIRKCR
jgi:hypothetical protein